MGARPRRPPRRRSRHTAGRRPARASAPRALGRLRTLDERKWLGGDPDVERRQLLHLLLPSSTPAEPGAALRAVLDATELEKPTVGGRRAVVLTARRRRGAAARLRGDGGGAARAALALVAPAVAAAAELPIVSVAVGAPNVAAVRRRAIGALVGGGVGAFAEVARCWPRRRLRRSTATRLEAATTAWRPRTRGVT